MILFCDTSALVKLYVLETFSHEMSELAVQANLLAVSRISWVETMAALARRARENPADERQIEMIRTRFRKSWQDFAVIEVSQPLVELAGEYADTFALRAYDSVQLAAARVLQEQSGEVFCFACFDTRLTKAAAVLGMKTLDGQALGG